MVTLDEAIQHCEEFFCNFEGIKLSDKEANKIYEKYLKK